MQIELVKWSPALKQELMNICNKVDRTFLSNRMPYPYTEESADWWLGMVSEHDGKDGVFRAIVVDSTVVGNISIELKADVYCRDAEIGYLLLTEFRSKGIMTEAVRLICEIAFAELDILRITGLVYAPNAASKRVLEKNGFVKEGIQRNAVCKDGEVYDLCLYGKLKTCEGADMKEKINISEYANLITEALPKGILLNTNGDKFNSMVIGWGHIGMLWGLPTFLVYVRQSRYTKGQIDKTGEFTVSVPLDGIIPAVNKVCGSQSGFVVDKVKEAGLTMAEPGTTGTPGIKEYPLTIECKVLYSQDQEADKIPGDIIKRYYPETAPGQCDFHTMYVGQIVDAYIIK